MAKMNNNPTLRIANQMDKIEKRIAYLTSYIDVLKKRDEAKREKKLEKALEVKKEALLDDEIRTLTKEGYHEAFIKPKTDEIEKSYHLKERELKQTFKRKLDKATDETKVTLNESLTSSLKSLQEEKHEKMLLIEKELAVHQPTESARKEAIKTYEAHKKSVQEELTELKKKLETEDHIRFDKQEARIQLSIDRLKTKLASLKAKHQVLLQNQTDILPDDVILRLENLRMQFGGLVAVSDLSFDVKKGEIFGLIGPNGAGKTTVFNCITQFYKPTRGKIYYKDKRLDTVNLNDYIVHDIVKQGIVRTFQNVELIWELSILDNLLVGAHSLYQTGFFHHLFHTRRFLREESVLRAKAIKVLTDLNLLQYKDFYPLGLPYGILKQVELARTLMTEPQLIILDEPAAGLNDIETDRLIETIRKIQKEYKVTIFLVEHDMGLVMELCDTICAISFGKKLAIGTPKEIQSNPIVQEAYLGGE